MRKQLEMKTRAPQGIMLTKAQVARLYELAGIPIPQPIDPGRVNLELVLGAIEKRMSRTQESKTPTTEEKRPMPQPTAERKAPEPPHQSAQRTPNPTPTPQKPAEAQPAPFDLSSLFDSGGSARKNFKSVLLIDDVGMIRYRLNKQLSAMGHQVEFARSQDEALDVCRGTDSFFDVIILDLLIPEEADGLRLLKALNQEYTGDKTLIIALVPYKCPQDIIEMAKRCGAKKVVEKSNCWLETLMSSAGF